MNLKKEESKDTTMLLLTGIIAAVGATKFPDYQILFLCLLITMVGISIVIALFTTTTALLKNTTKPESSKD